MLTEGGKAVARPVKSLPTISPQQAGKNTSYSLERTWTKHHIKCIDVVVH